MGCREQSPWSYHYPVYARRDKSGRQTVGYVVLYGGRYESVTRRERGRGGAHFYICLLY